jgi:MOSC domain-containing protein YiiM
VVVSGEWASGTMDTMDEPCRPVVVALRIAPGRRLPMKKVDEVVVETGRGIVGDRYHGTRHRHVSVQSDERLAEAATELGTPVLPEGTRRNVTISCGDVPTAPGSRIVIGHVELEVVRVAAPCRILDEEIAPGAAAALRRRAGSICRVLAGGRIRVGDPVRIGDTTMTRGAS